MKDGLILPVPDEAPLIEPLAAGQLPVIGQVAGGIAHRMAVFALDERALLVEWLFLLRPAIGLAVLDGVIHRREHIRMGPVAGLLIMHRAGWLALFDPLRAIDEILTIARLVTERPHDDARVVLVALDHVFHAVQVGIPPFRLFGEGFRAIAHAVGFDVGLIDDIESEFVAEFEESRIIRIVGSSHGIDVGALHLEQVGTHVLAGHVVTGQRVVIVAVHAFEEDRLAVVQELAIADFVAAETRLAAVMRDLAAIGSRKHDMITVEVRHFSGPGLHRSDLRDFQRFLGFAFGRNLQFCGRGLEGLPIRTSQGDSNLGALRACRAVGHLGHHFESAIAVVINQAGLDFIIAQVERIGRPQIDIAENPRKPEHVLVFEIGAV